MHTVSDRGRFAPAFTGKMSDYIAWRTKAELWLYHTKAKKEYHGSMLYSAQDNSHVQDRMLTVGLSVIKSADGIDRILDVMDQKFKPKKKTTAWNAYDSMDDMRRLEGETIEDFALRVETKHGQIQRVDASVTMSEHMLTLYIIKRCCLDQMSRALLLANMEEYRVRDLVDTVEDVFSGDAPWEDPNKKSKAKPKLSPDEEMQSAMFNQESEDEDSAAYWTKGRGKGQFGQFRKNDGIICERCGQNHEAKNCKLTWQQAQQSLKIQSQKNGKPQFQPQSQSEVGMLALPCSNCNDPNCEGWEYCSDDDDVFISEQEKILSTQEIYILTFSLSINTGGISGAYLFL